MTTDSLTVDAVIVGAGFSGLYTMHRLQNDLNLSVVCIDGASRVGGTWAWNQYPGAKSDSESFTYRYSFDQEFYAKTANWQRRYVGFREVQQYFEEFVRHFGLAEGLRLRTLVTAATWNEADSRWSIETDAGDTYDAKYLVPALGPLSTRMNPQFGGEDRFRGDIYYSSEYPQDISLAGKRVGVVGTGSTGTQIVPAVAGEVAQLAVFQRRGEWAVPAGDRDVTAAEREEAVTNYEQNYRELRNSSIAFGFEESTIKAADVSAEERERIFEDAWNHGGGFYFMYGTFSDIVIDEQANAWAREFIAKKIREIVKDPETAERLTPTELYARRPLCQNGYYEAFNLDHVHLVSVKDNPIEGFVEDGLKLADGTVVALDVVILATGFDVMDGSYNKIAIRGVDGLALRDAWSTGASCFMGIAAHGFPNMMCVFGPLSAFANNPPLIEAMVDFVTDLVEHAEQTGAGSIEVRREAHDRWVAESVELAETELFSKIENSWIFGRNVPGKPNHVLFNFKGLVEIREDFEAERNSGYPSYELAAGDRGVVEGVS